MEQQIKLLIIEDSIDDAILVYKALKREGYMISFQRVDSSESLEKQMTNQRWDLIITDYSMPSFDGIEAINIIKKFDAIVPIIVLSGAIGEEQAVAAMRAGANDYVLKENNLKRMTAVVKRELRESQARRVKEERLITLEKAVSQSRNVIFITDHSGFIIDANPRLEEVTGYTLEEVKDKDGTIEHLRVESNNNDSWHDMIINVGLSKKNWSGAILNRSKDGEMFWVLVSISPILDESNQVMNIVSVAEDLSKFKEKEQDLLQKAFHDPLTNLPNRRLLEEHLDHALKFVKRKNTCAALLCLDLDKFKDVNDTLGHVEGDNLLKMVSKRLQSSVREIDTVARFGGDEFNILLGEVEKEQDIVKVAENILSSLNKPFKLGLSEKIVSISIGIAIITKEGIDGKTPEVIIKNADKAMYDVKKQGRNNYKFYCERLNKGQKLFFTKEFDQALANNQFVLKFQPHFQLINNDAKKTQLDFRSVEAYLRWNYPEGNKGNLRADEFLSSACAESAIAIGKWVLNDICIKARRLSDMGIGPVEFYINISSSEFYNRKFVDTVDHIIRDMGMQPGWLVMEIDEHIVSSDIKYAQNIFDKLVNLGISISIDNFTANSIPVGKLLGLRIDTLKIDNAFLTELSKNKNYISQVVSIAHDNKLDVVGKRIETSDQKELFSKYQFDYGQGYYFGKPLDWSDVVDKMKH